MTGTFRDPSGSLFDVDGRILRNIRGPQAAAFRSMVDSAVVKSLIERGLLVATRPIEASEVPAALRGRDGEWFEHERIGFVSVPAEWSAMMLAHAARHTLTIGLELLRDGYVLKDATPANVLFRGARPVFVDLPSIERFAGGNGLWLARHQFETCFLLPLMASLDLGYPIQSALADPATGLSHERLARLYGPRRWWSVDRVRHVALAAALGGGTRGAEAALPRPTSGRASDLEKAKYVLEQSLRGLLRAIDRLEGRLRQRDSHWSAYAATRSHYADEDLRLKREFVGAVLEAGKPRWVLDVGANTGEFSAMAAAASAETVAVDLDEVSVSAIHATAAGSRLPIQALVVDLFLKLALLFQQAGHLIGVKIRVAEFFADRVEVVDQVDLVLHSLLDDLPDGFGLIKLGLLLEIAGGVAGRDVDLAVEVLVDAGQDFQKRALA